MATAIKQSFNLDVYSGLYEAPRHVCPIRAGNIPRFAMNRYLALLAPVALAVPFPGAIAGIPGAMEHGSATSPQATTTLTPAALTPAPQTRQSQMPPGWLQLDGPVLEGRTSAPVEQQIRIERRIVIRVSPHRANRTDLAADRRPAAPPPKLVERRIGKCFAMDEIGAVRTTRDDRLLLYMRDRTLIAADLEKSCSARDYYQGFYVEPSKDGKLCVNRDRLQSRTGVKCQLNRIRHLVAEGR